MLGIVAYQNFNARLFGTAFFPEHVTRMDVSQRTIEIEIKNPNSQGLLHSSRDDQYSLMAVIVIWLH